MSKMTTTAAFVFMLTSLSLTYFYGKPGADSMMPDQVQQVQNQAQQTADQATK